MSIDVDADDVDDVDDVPFDACPDVEAIHYRLAPIDVGFDLRASGMYTAVEPEDDPLSVSYSTRTGERRVVSWPQNAVVRHLRRHGYRIIVA